MNRDQWNFIVQASDGDGGDTAQREGMYAFALPPGALTTLRFNYQSNLLEVAPATWVRHPYQPEFRSDPAHMSRDQHDPLIAAWGHHKLRKPLKRSLRGHIKRFGRYQNKDWANPNTVSLYVRAFRAWYMWPLLLLTDFGLIISSIDKIIKSRDPNVSDDNNHIIRLLQAQRYLPTPVSWLARKIYKRFRRNGPQWALDYYHSSQFGGNPEMAELYRPHVERF